MRRVKGFTLLEVLIATGLLGVVLGAAFEMFSTGNRQAVKGIASVGLLSSALQLEQRLMHDLQHVMLPTTSPAVVVDLSGTYVSFYVPDPKHVHPVFTGERVMPSTTATWQVTGTELRFHLVDGPKGLFHPSRNQHVLKDVYLKSWRFYQTSPSTAETTGTTLEVDHSAHPLPPELRKRLGFPPARLPLKTGSVGSGAATTATSSTTSTGAAPSTTSTTATVPATAGAYLMVEYTLVDPQRGQELKRSLVWDLVNVRSKATYGQLYQLPAKFLTFPRRRSIPDRVEETFQRNWEERR